MSCKEKMILCPPTSKRCLEMIKMFEGWIGNKYDLDAKYSLKEKAKLTKIIKSNPSHVWFLSEKGLMHYEL